MHYLPAALIGEFAGEPDGGRRLPAAARDRRVWVARRRVPTVFMTRAANVGFDSDDRQLYRGSAYNLDELWQRAERDHFAVQALVSGILDAGFVPARGLANILVPYVAHLLARHPLLGLDGQASQLSSASAGHDMALKQRVQAFPRLADALLTDRRWLILRAPVSVPLVTNDLGWQWIPGHIPGEVFVPMSPRAAFVIRGDGRSYAKDADFIEVPVVTWPDEQVALRRDVMMLTAPKDVYAQTQEDVRRALRLWSANRPDPDREVVDGELASAHDLALVASSATADLLQENAAQDPMVAFARMLAIQHRWGCECEAALTQIEDATLREDARNAMHSHLAVGEQSLREQGLL